MHTYSLHTSNQNDSVNSSFVSSQDQNQSHLNTMRVYQGNGSRAHFPALSAFHVDRDIAMILCKRRRGVDIPMTCPLPAKWGLLDASNPAWCGCPIDVTCSDRRYKRKEKFATWQYQKWLQHECPFSSCAFPYKQCTLRESLPSSLPVSHCE